MNGLELPFWLYGSITTGILGASLAHKVLQKIKGRHNNTMRQYKAAKANLVITTIGTLSVLPALNEVLSKLREQRHDPAHVFVLTSNPLPQSLVQPFTQVIVPKDQDGNKYRAIKYFVKTHVKLDEWYVFLDDDSYPLDCAFYSDIVEAEAKGVVAMNGILKPRRGRNPLLYALEWIRFFDDHIRYYFALKILHKPLWGMHGELLIVKGKMLKEIWPHMPESLVEDFTFSQELMRRGYKVDQCSTEVSIKPPNSLKDYMKQRQRWSSGVLRESWRYKNMLNLVYTLTSVPVSLFFLPLWLSLNLEPVWPAVLAFLYYAFVYSYGAYKARMFPYVHVLLLSCMEVLGVLAGVKKVKKFVVIDKR